MNIEMMLGGYAKGALDSAMSRGILTPEAEATLAKGLAKAYVDWKVDRGDAKPFLTMAEHQEQQQAAEEAAASGGVPVP